MHIVHPVMSNTENAHVYYKYPKTHFTETFLYIFSMGTGLFAHFFQWDDHCWCWRSTPQARGGSSLMPSSRYVWVHHSRSQTQDTSGPSLFPLRSPGCFHAFVLQVQSGPWWLAQNQMNLRLRWLGVSLPRGDAPKWRAKHSSISKAVSSKMYGSYDKHFKHVCLKLIYVTT